jgi:hypothetical protein
MKTPIQGGRWRAIALLSALAGASLVLAGCESVQAARRDMAQFKPYVPQNHAGDAVLPAGLRRVVVLPVSAGEVANPESAAALDPVVIEALERQNRFEVVPISRGECRDHFHADSVSSVGALPANFLSVIRREYRADAVMFVDLTVYKAYQPLSIGLRAKLAMIDDARLVWTFDNVFAAENPVVARSAARFLQAGGENDLPSDLNSAVLESPGQFASYALSTMFSTLPPVTAAAPKGAPAGSGAGPAKQR